MDDIDEITGSIYIGGPDEEEEIFRLNNKLNTDEKLTIDEILILTRISHAVISPNHLGTNRQLFLDYISLINILSQQIDVGEYDKVLSNQTSLTDIAIGNLYMRINAHSQTATSMHRKCYEASNPKDRIIITELMLKLFNSIGSAFSIEKWCYLKSQIIYSNESSVSEPKHTNSNFVNHFNSISEDIIKDYFSKHLVETKLIDNETLTHYLQLAFDKKELPINKITIEWGHKNIGKVKKVFYDFYKTISGGPYGKKNEYVLLLTDYFEGFNHKAISDNFK